MRTVLFDEARICALLALASLSLQAWARQAYPLNGVWSYRFDGEPACQVSVPHTWNALDAADGTKGKCDTAKSVDSTAYKRGAAVYSRLLPMKPKPGKRYFVRGGGASIVSEASVNGKPVGSHEGAFTAFCYEITPVLREQANRLDIKVDNSVVEHVAPLRGDFSMFGGLYRPVELIETDQVCIDPLFYASPGVFLTVMAMDGRKAEVEAKVRVNAGAEAGGPRKVAVKADVLDREGRTVATNTVELTPGAGTVQEAVIPLVLKNPVLWQAVENPYLYRVRISIRTEDGQTDEIMQPLGLRSAVIDPGKGFVLNGKPMQIKGVCRHQDMKGKGWALAPEDEVRDIELIAGMGANGLRTGHYSQSAHMYDLCDRAGLIVWSEVPNVNMVRDTPEFRSNNRLQAQEMIYQNWNHPSICMWGLFNEIYHQPDASTKGVDMERELSELKKFVKETDPHRMTVAASNQPGRKKLNGIPDHLAFNMYPGWYGGGPETMGPMLDNYLRNYPSSGVAISEYGHGASIGMHENPLCQPRANAFWHPEEWQAHGHEINYKCIRERPGVWGSFVWNMFDFGSVSRHEGDKPGINDKGLVTYDRKTPKDAYFFYKANWSRQPVLYITSRRFAERSRSVVPVKVYSNAPDVKLFVNGKSLGSVKTDDLKRAVWPEVVLSPGANTIRVEASIGGKIHQDSCRWVFKPSSGGAPDAPEKYQAASVKAY